MRLLFAALALLPAPPALLAQVPTTKLAKPDARLNHEFSAISGFRELADGRVLVSDGIDETVLRIDLRTGKMDTLARSGSGPGEYKSPDLLFETPGGGTLLVDLGNARLSFYDAALKYQESMPIAKGEPGRGPMMMVIPQGVDAQGRIYIQAIMREPGRTSDSGAVIRYDRAKATSDTVAKLKMGEVEVSSSGGPNNRSVSMRPVPLSPEDEWGVGADGRVAIARAANYTLEWVGAGKPAVKGPANRFTPVAIRDADKKEYIQDGANGLAIMVQNDNGRMSVSMRRGGLQQAERDEAERIKDLKWPAAKPAARNVVVAPGGEAWVERYVAAGAPREFDVFGADGKLVRRVVLPAGRRLVGFGKGAVYLRETTADELSYLERYKI
jgi:hypothetical protein